MNQANGLLDKMDAQFIKLKDMQNGSVLSNVLLGYVKAEALKAQKHIFSEDHPRKWRRIQTLGDPRVLSYTKEGNQAVFSSLVVPYRGESRVLTGTEDDTELPEELDAVREQLNLCLELAGQFLSSLTDSQSMPDEVSICNDPCLAWLLLLHYVTKPKQYEWIRVQRDSKDMDSSKGIGSFSFSPLQENSYSVIRDIATSSVLVISQLKSGLLSPNEESYTIGQLIKDLLSYETLTARSEGYFQKREGQPAMRGSAAAQYAIMANAVGTDASKVRKSIPSDAFDLIRPLCESQGEEFNSNSLKTLRGKLCIKLGKGVSVIDAMSLIDFNKECSELLSPQEHSSDSDNSKKSENVSNKTNCDNVQQEESYTLDQLARKAGYSNRNGFIKKSKPFGVTCDKNGPWTPSQACQLFENILEAGGIQAFTENKMIEAVSEWSKTK